MSDPTLDTFRTEPLPPDVEFDLAVLADDVEKGPLVVAPISAELTLEHAREALQAPELPPDLEFEAEMILAAPEAAKKELIGDEKLAARPAFFNALAAKAAMDAPATIARKSIPRQRQLDFAFGPAFGPAGAVVSITARPQCLFRGEKLMATDTSPTPGLGTSIVSVAVGQKLQRPVNAPTGSLTKFFSETARANGITYDTAHPWEDIVLTVSFIVTCTFQGNLFGTAELD